MAGKLARELSLPRDAEAPALLWSTIGAEPPLVAAGEWRGSILLAPSGDGGFGYDPLFLDPESGQSSATLTAEEKNARSHRGQALRQLIELIAERYP